MGRKLIGLTVGFLLTVLLAFYMFPPEYDAIIRWLAPFFGPWLRFVFMFLFLVFANPLTYTTVAIIWIIVGLIAGLLSRSHGGAVGVGVVIFLLAFLMLVFGVIGMLVPSLLGGGLAGLDPIALLSTIPPDVSIFEIISAPVIGPIVESLLTGLGDIFGGSGGPTLDIAGLLQTVFLNALIVPAIMNAVILIVAGLIGGAIGRAIKRPD
jgi:hypothetical protein